MAMAPSDKSAFANMNTSMTPTPDFLKQDSNPTVPGAISNMIKAIMAGNNKYNMMQGMTGGGGRGGAADTSDGAWYGNSSVGGAPLAGMTRPVNPASMPASVTPPPTTTMTGSPMTQPTAPPPPPTSPSPFEGGAGPMPFAPSPGMLASNGAGSMVPGMPNGTDKSMEALFSRIPGEWQDPIKRPMDLGFPAGLPSA